MAVNLEKIINRSPKQLSDLKKKLLSEFRFEDAEAVEGYIRHCIATSRLIKSILKG